VALEYLFGRVAMEYSLYQKCDNEVVPQSAQLLTTGNIDKKNVII
jgi:hypothetical protein